MREILFRGKRLDNGEWVEGHYNYSNWYLPPSMKIVDTTYHILPIGHGDSHRVAPETVAQFTGLTDENGKKIFEGDIVRYNTFDNFDCHSVVKFGEYKQDGSSGEYNPRDCIGWYVDVDNFTCPDWAEDDPTYFNSYLNQQNLNEVASSCEVIGNIHDNPELLGGEWLWLN